jgi:ATP-dependent Clp protease adaptor protein ClpS
MAAPDSGGKVLERTQTTTREPPLYKVVLHNDDYTTMEFVVQVLETVFLKQPAEAFRIMMQVHIEGRGLCGAYPYDVAETRVDSVHTLAHSHNFPLRASLEED